MKNVIVLLVLVFSATLASGQCAIYTSDNAAWGAGFRADDDPVYTMAELKKIGLDICNGKGGINCKLLYASEEGGWWGLLMGDRADGRTLYEAVYGQSTEAGAKSNLLELYRRHNGNAPQNARIKTWHVKGK